MKKLIFVLLMLAAACNVYAAQDQAFLAILAETKLTKMVGMPAMPDMSEASDGAQTPADMRVLVGFKLPGGLKLPGGAKLPGGSKPETAPNPMMPGAPQRILNVRLWSPGIAPANATASIAPPAGLKQGDKLDLELYRPKADEGTTGGTGAGEFDPDSMPEFTIKIYWGSSETVKPGQPKIIKWGGLTADQKEAMKKRAKEARMGQSYFYKPDWTTGYWPTPEQPGKISKDASLVGNYTLTTNYTGNVSIDAPDNVDFLAPIDMSSPNLDSKIDFTKFLPFVWKEIPNALGLYASIMGMEGKSTMIMWSSSEVFKEGLMGDMGFLQMAEVREFVKQTVFMKGDRTKVDVPEAIFANADMAMFNMVGYGPGAALDKAQPLPRIQTKTTLSIMLGGKMMAGMGE